MQAIINRKKYNTETAQEIDSYWNQLPPNDFNYLKETLYRKKTGEFFFYADGGAATKYSVSIGHASYRGQRIIPLSLECAKSWCEQHVSVSTYEELFGEVEE